MNLRMLPVILFHALPLIPILLSFGPLTFAAIFLVLLPYIKAKKVEQLLRDLREKNSQNHKEIRSLERNLAFWRSFTFLQFLD